MKSRFGLGFALVLLAPMAQVQAQEGMRKLHVDRGSVVVEYERATADADEFARLSGATPRPAVVVTVADGTADGAGHTVAAAYADALRGGFPGAKVAAAGETAPDGGYLAEVTYSSGSQTVEVSEKVYGTRQTGTACVVQPDNSVKCDQVGSAPIALGTRSSQQDREQVAVTIRLQRLGVDDGGRPTGTVVFEDSYRISYPAGECTDGTAAAATLASAVAGNALSADPLNIRFDSSPRRLHCR